MSVEPNAAATPPWSLDVRLDFRAGSFGTAIGARGLHVIDLDGDGRSEIVASADTPGPPWTSFWYVLSRRGTTYRQTWISGEYPTKISSLAVGAVDADEPPEVAIALPGGRVEVYDGLTRALQATIQTKAVEVRSLQVVDVDADGRTELVFCAPDGLHVYDALSGAPEAVGVLDDCYPLQVGNVDADASPEIVIGDGSSTSHVIDGATGAVEWSYPPGFGWTMTLADLDADGIDEIVGAQSWSRIGIYDAISRVEEKVLSVSDTIGAIAVADLEQDGYVELMWASQQGIGIHVVDAATMSEKWQLATEYGGYTRVVVADTDGDGANELIAGDGQGSTAPDHLYVFDALTRQLEWKSIHLEGPFLGITFGDLEGDGRPDLVHTAYRAETFGAGRYLVYGLNGQRLRYVSQPVITGPQLSRVRAVNVDSDTQLELLTSATSGSQPSLVAYDGVTNAEQWRAPIPDRGGIWSLEVGDLDGDGRLEAVVGTIRDHSSAPGPFIYVFDAHTGSFEWRSPNLSSAKAITLLRLANVDADPALEIVAGENDGRVFVVDGASRAVSVVVSDDATALETDPQPAGLRSDLVVGTAGGELLRINVERQKRRAFTAGGYHSRRDFIGRYGDRINGLAAYDFTGDGVEEYAFAVAGRLLIVDPRTREVLWQSPYVGTGAGVCDSLRISDVDWDGRPELIVNTGQVGIEVYQVSLP